MKISVDPSERSVTVTVSPKAYSDDAVRIAAAVFGAKAEVYDEGGRSARALTLVAKRALDARALEALGGDFLNELLNQEYRFLVARFNRAIADRIATQTLLAARGGETPPAPPADTPELKAETERLLAEAAEEIRRTMPKRLPPQGAPIRAPKEADGR
ncbi:MAG: hypothetical protein KGM24_12660 [Elusimicrobia bacterium]|nr:hypothetical protein [Elusimicrobiota bacterium]